LLYGKYFDWINNWSENRNNLDTLFLTFEDLKSNLEFEIERISIFLNIDFQNHPKKKEIVQHCSFEYMKQNQDKFDHHSFLNVLDHRKKDFEFIRKGIVGDYQNYFTKEQLEQYEILYDENITKKNITLWNSEE